MSENLSLLPSHPHSAEVPSLSHLNFVKVQNRIAEQVHPVQKTRTSRRLCVVCSYFPVLGKLDSHAVSERSSQSHRGCHRLQIHGCSEERGSMDAFRGACGKCVLRWNNPCLSVAVGGPLPGPGGVVLPGQHPPGHLRLGLLVGERRRPLRPAGSLPACCSVKSPTTHQQPSSLPLQVYRSKQKFTGYFKWNPTLVAKQKPVSITGSCPSEI